MADVIVETSGIGFSVQAVADRAGLTHRTVYNHFPSREALCEAFSRYVDEILASTEAGDPQLLVSPKHQASFPLESFPAATDAAYRTFGEREHYVRAYVMLMFGNRRPLESWKERTRAIEKLLDRRVGFRPPLPPRQAAAAIRLFGSSFGWHLLTEHCGLSTEEAATTGAWATQTLLAAATGGRAGSARGNSPGRRVKRGTAKATSRDRS